MARARPQGSRLQCLSLSYYIRRPHRLALLCIVFVVMTYMFWDRQVLIREHEDALHRLSEENEKLTDKLDEVKSFLREKGEELPSDLDTEEPHDFEGTTDAENKDETGEDDESDDRRARPALVLKNGVLNGMHDAPADPDPVARERRDKVREAMIHAWTSYEKYAWGYDELMPTSKRGVNHFQGLGATILDALDTLFIMGLHDEFTKATEWVSSNLNFDKHGSTSVFETTIRVLGGLLSAYDLSGNKMFLDKAKDLADRLLPAWETSTGIPMTLIDLASGNANNPHWTGGSSVLADIGTEQVEFIGLSQRTGIPKYREKVEKVILKLRESFPSDGLLPIYISPHTGQPTNQRITFGAMGDSFYEYLLKVWVLGNKTHAVAHYRAMWEQSMEGLISLVKKSSPSSFLYIAERSGDSPIHKMDELACFAPGMLALGIDGASPEKGSQYLEIAEGLARTCYNFYLSTNSKLAGENYHFRDGQDFSVGAAYNILRPETVESFFYLWRRTGNSRYRDWGWNIFQAFEAQSRVPTGYVGLMDVNSGQKDDMMQSFFVAETLKYLYLLFSPPSVIPLDEWVFNTEAHPIRIIPRVEDDEGMLETKTDFSRDRETGSEKASQLKYIRNGGLVRTTGTSDDR